jgi:hypothetical protein
LRLAAGVMAITKKLDKAAEDRITARLDHLKTKGLDELRAGLEKDPGCS